MMCHHVAATDSNEQLATGNKPGRQAGRQLAADNGQLLFVAAVWHVHVVVVVVSVVAAVAAHAIYGLARIAQRHCRRAS